VPASDALEPMRFSTLFCVRITAKPAAIDAATWPAAAIMVRVAPDDALVIDATVDDAAPVVAADPHAIIEPEAMFRGAWLDDAQLEALTHKLEWPLPTTRPALAQGMVCGLAIKLVMQADRTMLIVSGSAFHEVPDRLGAVA
jgi:hypothetical protein